MVSWGGSHVWGGTGERLASFLKQPSPVQQRAATYGHCNSTSQSAMCTKHEMYNQSEDSNGNNNAKYLI